MSRKLIKKDFTSKEEMLEYHARYYRKHRLIGYYIDTKGKGRKSYMVISDD